MRPSRLALLSLCLALQAMSARAADRPGELFYIGSQGSGPGQGISAARLDPATGQLTSLGVVAQVDRPGWLLANPRLPVLYAAGAGAAPGAPSSISSFSVDAATGALTLIDKVPSGGGDAAHMALNLPGQTLFVAHFGTGQVAALPLRSDGGVLPPVSVQDQHGAGPHRRQGGPHAHGVAVSRNGRFVIATDFGADRLFVYNFDAATKMLSPAATSSAPAPPGSGPRHLLFHPNGRWLFVNTELAGGVQVYRWDGRQGELARVNSVIADSTPEPTKRSAAEIGLSRDGRYLYASSRGDNTIAVYAVDGRTGDLTEVQRMPDPGKTPWAFGIDPSGRWMVIANQGSGSLAVLKVDPVTGKLADAGQSLSVPTPVNVTFWPR